MAPITRPVRIRSALQLKVLHPIKEAEKLVRQRVLIEPCMFEREQQLMRCFQRRKTTAVWLLFDHIPARRGGGEHDPRQTLEARGETQHFTSKRPGCVDQEDYKSTMPQRLTEHLERSIGRIRSHRREIDRITTRVEEDGNVLRIRDDRLNFRMLIEADPHEQIATLEAEVSKPAGRRLLLLEFLRMHQEHKPRAGCHWRDRFAPTERLRPEASVTGDAHQVEARAGAVIRQEDISYDSGVSRRLLPVPSWIALSSGSVARLDSRLNTSSRSFLPMLRRFLLPLVSFRPALLVLLLGFQAGETHGAPRVPWTTSRIVGSADAPKAFVAEPVLATLKFSEGLELASVPGTDRLLVVERRGKILSFPVRHEVAPSDEVIDLLKLHPKLDNAFGVVLHPKYRDTRQIFVCYAMPNGQPEGTRVSRFTLTSLDPLRADPASEEVIITWRSGGHNGGSLQFGPDGYLYISTGDAGPAAPPDVHATGQDVTDLLASVLRIDVDRRDAGKNYRVPPDNPWAGEANVRPELWAYGLRNPWKISFDRATGNLWCGDVGWEMWELVHLIRRGGNYGWSAYEAGQPIKPDLLNPLSPITRPVVAHTHAEAASITGGFVYRGKRLPELLNAYIYGDYVTGKIWALWHDGNEVTRHEEIADTPHAIVTFGESDDGELYYLHFAGPATTLQQLTRNPQASQVAKFPRTLSETGLFADVAQMKLAPGVQPFDITTPLWEDGAEASRVIALPDRSSVVTTARRLPGRREKAGRLAYTTTWPKNAVLARTITLGRLAAVPAERSKPIETQVLHYDGENWNAYSYRWNEASSDAVLVPSEGAEMTLRVPADPNASDGALRDYTWRFQSRAECLRCHNSRTPVALAFAPAQLRSVEKPQVAALIEAAIVDANFFEQDRDHRAQLEGQDAAARGWLQVNCAHCHTAHAGGSVSIFLNHELTLAEMHVVNASPTQGGFGLPQPKVIAPGDPWSSILAVRMAKSGNGHMPLIGARHVDVEGLKIIEDWIARLPADRFAPKPWAAGSINRETIEEAMATLPGAMRIRRAIDDGVLDAAMRANVFKLGWASSDPTIRDIFERFKPDHLRDRTLGATIDPASILRLQGDAANGAKLLAADGKLASCQACHVIQGQGRHFGPDLSRIGEKQSSAQILDSILSPSKTVAPLFRTTVVSARDGTSQVGFVRARGSNEIVLAGPGGTTAKLKIADIEKEEALLTSLMPEGLLQGLTSQEAADLLAYLVSLK
jgi:putative heme-binding domain-containing protein